MAQPPPVQRPLQVRPQEVLANIQTAPELPVAQVPNAVAQIPNAVAQGPNAVAQGPNAAPAHVAAPENADAGNNQDAAVPEPQLEVNIGCFPIRLVFYLYLLFYIFGVLPCWCWFHAVLVSCFRLCHGRA